jgi:hypothetical protein
MQTAFISTKHLISLPCSKTRKPRRFYMVERNRGPRQDALWNARRFDIRLWETEFCAQRLSGEFKVQAL